MAKTILIADDYPGLAELVAEQLQTLFDVETVCATDGIQALCAARAGHYEAILLDLDMPGMSGVEVAESIRALGATPPRLVAMTGGGPTLAKARSGLFDEILLKPVSIETLERVLRL